MPASASEILRRVGERRPAAQIRLEEDAVWRSETRTILKGDALWPRVLRAESGSVANTGHPVNLAVQPVKTDRRTQVDETKNTPVPATAPSQPAVPGAPATPASPAAAPAAGGDKISIDDFMKVDLRVAKVLTAEKVPNSRKLVKMTIDVGTEQRTLVAGIAEAYEPEQLVGRTIAMVFNLKPAKLMGIESNGMVLAASPEGGKPTLVSFDGDVPPGSRVR
jgi:methionine--tRNA ligase beta chain